MRFTNSIERKSGIVKKYLNHKISKQNASKTLGVSERTFERYTKSYITEGIDGLIHKNTGRIPHNKRNENIENVVLSFYYSNKSFKKFNFCHMYTFFEKSKFYHLAPISYSTFRYILLEHGIKSKFTYKTGAGKKYGYSKNKYGFGQVVEYDACETDWFDNGQTPHLHLAVDRGTDAPLSGYFEEQETTHGYFKVTERMVKIYGFPEEIRTDRRMSFTNNKDDENFTQFERVMAENNVYMSSSSVPESKPCVERTNRTFEDRLRSELIYYGIDNVDDANKFVPKFIAEYIEEFNKLSGVEKSYFTPSPEGFDCNFEFSIREQRVLRKNSTVYFEGNIYNINLPDNSFLDKDYAGEVIKMLDGNLKFECGYGTFDLHFVKRNINTKSHPTLANHPWKNGK